MNRSARGWYTVLALAVILASCRERASSQQASALHTTEAFRQYWYAGKAEINSYSLSESRYGENVEGDAMLIFVTEPFSKKKHVKLDDPEKNKADEVTVMKLNFTKNFITGIYPYSIMLSVFSPVQTDQFPHALKLVMSSQEWCGQNFSEMNLEGKKFDVQQFSYFEAEGNRRFSVDATWLEDEIWNQIRLAPEGLPQGEFKIIPGLLDVRLRHRSMDPQSATATLTKADDRYIYEIRFSGNDRALRIVFQSSFPHRITGWEETFINGGESRSTVATLKKTMVTDYWNKNRPEHRHLRDSLGLSR